MKILVSGTSGYVGYILQQWLIQNTEHQIIPLTGRLENLKKKSLEADLVIHCAGALRYRTSELIVSNITGTKKLIESLKNKPDIIYMSSKSVYGLQRKGVVTEKDMPRPDDEYGSTKLEAERIIQSSGCNYIILRLSGIFGELYGRSGHCFPDQALRKFRNGEVVELTDEKVDHEYIHIGTIIQVIGKLIISNKGWNEVYNLSGKREPLQDLISKITEGNFQLKKMPTREWIFLDHSKIYTFMKNKL